jgi:hypothetical protein
VCQRAGWLVRSKSEVIIANKLYARGIPYTYEQELRLQDARRLPDFTIDDADTGRTIYWEHLGMLRDPAYRQSWEEKQAWYRRVGILPLDEDGGAQGTLVWTRDDDQGGIDCPRIDEVIDRLFGP